MCVTKIIYTFCFDTRDLPSHHDSLLCSLDSNYSSEIFRTKVNAGKIKKRKYKDRLVVPTRKLDEFTYEIKYPLEICVCVLRMNDLVLILNLNFT